MEDCGFDFGSFYDSEAESGADSAGKGAEAKAEEKDLSDNIELSYRLEITCVNETEQEQMFNELSERGFVCKILTL